MVDADRQAALMEMAVPLPSFEQSADDGPFGASSYKELTSPRSKKRSNGPVHADVVINNLLENSIPAQQVTSGSYTVPSVS